MGGPPQVPVDRGSPKLERVQTRHCYAEDCDGAEGGQVRPEIHLSPQS